MNKYRVELASNCYFEVEVYASNREEAEAQAIDCMTTYPEYTPNFSNTYDVIDVEKLE